jgi:hypothetical protein
MLLSQLPWNCFCCVQVVQLLHQLKSSAHIGSMLLPVHQVRHAATDNKVDIVQQHVM